MKTKQNKQMKGIRKKEKFMKKKNIFTYKTLDYKVYINKIHSAFVKIEKSRKICIYIKIIKYMLK